jgi:hypothetical protein
MLLDKWTNGELQVEHRRLRRLSGDLHGGSSFEDLRVAFGRLGFRVPLDAAGDSTMTWRGLLGRLKRGAGAVVLGDYSGFPRWYGRWDYRFWKGKARSDNHAVYVERYDPRHGRVWLMDPLGRGDYAGEWISVGSLYRYAWFKGGRVQAIATPTAKPAPFRGVTLGIPSLGRSGEAVSARWPLRAPRGWRFAGADVRVSVAAATDPLVAAARTAQVGPRVTGDVAPARPVAKASRGILIATAALPDAPGAYDLAFTLTDRRFGHRVADAGPMAVFVPGQRRATIRLVADDRDPAPGSAVRIAVTVSNDGEVTWADPRRSASGGRSVDPRGTRIVARWIRLDATSPDAGDARATSGVGKGAVEGPVGVEVRRVPLGPGATAHLKASVTAPAAPGRWALVIDIVDDLDGSFAALGSAPAVALFDVVPRVPSDPEGAALE